MNEQKEVTEFFNQIGSISNNITLNEDVTKIFADMMVKQTQNDKLVKNSKVAKRLESYLYFAAAKEAEDTEMRDAYDAFRAAGKSESIRGLKYGTGSTPSSWILEDDEPNQETKLSLSEIRQLALEYGYSLVKIEYEQTELPGTNKINIKE